MRKQADADELEKRQPRCSKCDKELTSTNTDGVCKHCAAAAQRRRAEILGAIAVGGVAVKTGGPVIKKYGPKIVSLAMKVIRK